MARASAAYASRLASAANIAHMRTKRPLELKLKGPSVVENVLGAVVCACVLLDEVVLLDVIVRVHVHAHVVPELARDRGAELIVAKRELEAVRVLVIAAAQDCV